MITKGKVRVAEISFGGEPVGGIKVKIKTFWVSCFYTSFPCGCLNVLRDITRSVEVGQGLPVQLIENWLGAYIGMREAKRAIKESDGVHSVAPKLGTMHTAVNKNFVVLGVL